MKDEEKTKAQLLQELGELRPKVAEFEVMEHALVTLPVPIEWPDEDDDDEIKVSESKDAESIVTH